MYPAQPPSQLNIDSNNTFIWKRGHNKTTEIYVFDGDGHFLDNACTADNWFPISSFQILGNMNSLFVHLSLLFTYKSGYDVVFDPKPSFIYCSEWMKCFLILFCGLLIFLVMSISSMWHVAPQGDWAQRFGSDCETNQVCLSLQFSESPVCAQTTEWDGSVTAALWIASCVLWFFFFSLLYFPVLRLGIICKVSDF